MEPKPMGDEPYTTQRKTSHGPSSASRSSTSPHQAAYASKRAELLFGCYRRGDANDPDTYVAAIAAVLARYDTDLIREVTDPNTGIQTSEKFMTFMPNAGELKVYSDVAAARMDRIQRLGSLPSPDFTRARLAPPPPMPGDLATVFVPASNARFPSLLDWATLPSTDPRKFKYDARPGIWVSYDIWDERQTAARSIGHAAAGVAREQARDRAESLHHGEAAE
jgi:hypothetical protein